MVSFINNFNFTIFLIFTLLYAYQIYYAVVVLIDQRKTKEMTRPHQLHRYAVIIAARNESAVIAQLIRSVKLQNYPSELVDTYVVADNCTDDTAEVARQAGACVYERFNLQQVGKGYALNFIFNLLHKEKADKQYEAYIIFDADNLLDQNYISEMNKTFDQGYEVITSYRNSKNYDSNWISAGYALWFLREAKYLNHARMLLGTNCAISGTGFLVAAHVIEEQGGWIHHLLTEDIEFSIDSAIRGRRIGYCADAVLYDEQPCTFSQSWTQRLRWSKGFYQVFGKYGFSLVQGAFQNRSFSCFDMLMTIAPAMFVSLATVIVNVYFLGWALLHPMYTQMVTEITLGAVFASCFNFYMVLYVFGLLTTITEWKRINTTPAKKILYTFSFPIFIFTYVPIAIVALFKRIEWQPITHSVVKSIEDVH